MYFGLGDDGVALRDLLRGLLKEKCPPALIRQVASGGVPAAAADLWRTLAEVGVFATLLDEAHGGLGLTETAMVAVLEETGYAGVPLPTTETVAVVVPLLSGSSRRDLLDSVLSGRVILSCWLDSVTGRGGGEPLVPYGATATGALVATAGGVGLVDFAGTGPERTVDGVRSLIRVDPGSATPLDIDPAEIRRAALRATVGVSAELLGLGRRMLDIAVDYVKTREQFGAPVGSFQAVKHHLANALLAVEFARPAVLKAGYSLATGDPDAERDVSMAKAMASQAALTVAKLTLQCHGAIAYTTEYDHQLFAKRAWALAAAWGGATAHRQRLADLLGLIARSDPRPVQAKGALT
jgi:alkylation response protein AidB-like acyl-CoA dehydrogenase